MTASNEQALFPVPRYRGGEHGNTGTFPVPENTEDRLHESSGNVPGTPKNGRVPRSRTLYPGTEERGTVSTRRKAYRVDARASTWANADGTTDPIVKLFGGSRGSIAVDYTEIPKLISDLAKLLLEHAPQGSPNAHET